VGIIYKSTDDGLINNQMSFINHLDTGNGFFDIELIKLGISF